MCLPTPRRRLHPPRPLKILLTNGRFPVSIDLARQLKLAGHQVYALDPMHYHVCKFSNSVEKSYRTPAPHVNAKGYMGVLKRVVKEEGIDLVMPMHEEIFYIAEGRWMDLYGDWTTDRDGREIWEEGEDGDGDGYAEGIVREKARKFWNSFSLAAPPFPVLIMLHNKWEFSRFLKSCGLDTPMACLVKSYADIKKLVGSESGEPGLLQGAFNKDGLALKPVYGRACSNVFHLKPNDPKSFPEEVKIDVSSQNHYIAQEWLTGDRFCSYSIIQSGKVLALGVYPVQDTIDGSSCAYFEAVQHEGIRAYVEKLAQGLKDVTETFQIALDFVETPLDHQTCPGRLVAIECNPRATSGVHLWSRTPHLAAVLTAQFQGKAAQSPSSSLSSSSPSRQYTPPSTPLLPKNGARQQLAPGMLMWEHKNISTRQYLVHMKRLMSSKDVLFSMHDIVPSLMQPFLLTSYYEICREKKMELPEMFQWDFVWEPSGRQVSWVRRVIGREEVKRGIIREDEVEEEETEGEGGDSRGEGTQDPRRREELGQRSASGTILKGGLQAMPGKGDEEGRRRDSVITETTATWLI